MVKQIIFPLSFVLNALSIREDKCINQYGKNTKLMQMQETCYNLLLRCIVTMRYDVEIC